MGVLEALRRSRKFWLAVVAIAQTVIFAFVPDFPDAVWIAIDALLVVLIESIAREDAAVKRAGGNVRFQ